MKKLLLTVLIGVFAFAISHAEGISGKWKASLEGPQGSIELTFTYKVDGTKLTGTVSSPMGDEQIKNGKVNGNDFTYEVSMMDNTVKYNGKLEKDVIKLTMKFPEGGPGGPGGDGGPGEMTLKKVE